MSEAAINLAYLALVVGPFCKSLRWVRVLLVVAAAFFVAYGVMRDIGSMVVWNLIIGGLNVRLLAVEVYGDARVQLTAEQEMFRQQLFSNLSPSEFKRLWLLGRDIEFADERIVKAGTGQRLLFLVVRGVVHVRQDDLVLDVLGPGAVIGELEPSPYSCPSADWDAIGAVWLRCWQVEELRELDLPRRLRQSLIAGGEPIGSAF